MVSGVALSDQVKVVISVALHLWRCAHHRYGQATGETDIQFQARRAAAPPLIRALHTKGGAR